LKEHKPLKQAGLVAVAALVLLGFIGGTLIVVHSGFETSPKRGGTSVFVPAPQAYILAAMLFSMSIIGWVALIREWRRSIAITALSIVLYFLLAVLIISRFTPK
jgi:predicted tellurium resistance membrane protein TerC